jgi:hypothetical protein
VRGLPIQPVARQQARGEGIDCFLDVRHGNSLMQGPFWAIKAVSHVANQRGRLAARVPHGCWRYPQGTPQHCRQRVLSAGLIVNEALPPRACAACAPAMPASMPTHPAPGFGMLDHRRCAQHRQRPQPLSPSCTNY